jgi:hypothetical protein
MYQKYFKKQNLKEDMDRLVKSSMTIGQAIKKDKSHPGGHVYAEEMYGEWFIFGSESGFAYASPPDRKSAEKMASEMNHKYGLKIN